MKDHYFDPVMQVECEAGYRDGLNGISRSGHSPHGHAYLGGREDGAAERTKKIHNARIENLKKARGEK